MRLVDNNVPRAVTHALRDLGADVEEVRAILGQGAGDDEISAYATATGRWVITHDVRFAKSCLRAGLPHVWLRVREADDRDAIINAMPVIEDCLKSGSIRVVINRKAIDCVGGADGDG